MARRRSGGSGDKHVRWSGPLEMNLQTFDRRVITGMIAAAEYTKAAGVTYMRTNAKWKDQTGAARNGLQGKVVAGVGSVAVVFYHTVDYGVWLETRWSGKYAIIRPTMAAMGPQFLVAAKRIFS